MSIVKPKQAETVMQAAGLKAIVGPGVNLSLCSSMRLPPEIAAILYACRYSEACLFELIGRAPYLRMPPGPTVQHLLGRPLRSPAGRWMETCRWARVPAQDETQTKLSNSYDLSRVLADIVLTFGHQVYPGSPIGLVSQYAKIVVQMKFMLQKSVPAEQLGGDHMSLMEACQTAEDFPLAGPPNTWSLVAFRTFLMKHIAALKRFFSAITTACSTGPTHGVCVFVTCRASGFLFNSEAGLARATSSFTRGLGPLVFVAPHYSDGIGACFQMAACATGVPAHTSQPVEHGWPWHCNGITQASLQGTEGGKHCVAREAQGWAGPLRYATPGPGVGTEGYLGRDPRGPLPNASDRRLGTSLLHVQLLLWHDCQSASAWLRPGALAQCSVLSPFNRCGKGTGWLNTSPIC